MADFSWYYNRFLKMTPIEVFQRLRAISFSKYEKYFIWKKKRKIGRGLLIENLIYTSEDNAFLNEFYNENTVLKEKIIQVADEVLQNKISIFPLKELYLGEKINWNYDYKNEIHSPMSFYADIDYKDSAKNGEVKYIWELNRFQHIVPLIQAYALTKRIDYAKEITKQILSWIEENPYLTGVNWTNSLECSLRILNWGFALSLFNFFDFQIEQQDNEKIEKSIYEHIEFIKNHMSYGSSANNHLIAEATGLIFAGCVFDYGEISKKWLNIGKTILQKELLKQVHLDGFLKEQSLSYHCFTYELFFLSFLLLERYGFEMHYTYWTRLKKMAQAIYFMSDDDLNIPDVGDSDDAFVLKFVNSSKKENLRFILNTASIMFKQRLFKTKAQIIDEKTLWFLGNLGYSQYEEIRNLSGNKRSVLFANSGYSVFKDKSASVVFDAGQVGYLSIAAHGHSDALSVFLSYKNEPFLVDSGTYSYSDAGWMAHFKGTSAHNTLVVDKISQSLLGGPFLWQKKADVKIEDYSFTRHYDYIRASHNGYKKQDIGIEHVREVYLSKNDFLLVVDTVLNTDNQEHSLDLYWHFDEKCEINGNNNSFIIAKSDKKIFMETFCMDAFTSNLIGKDGNVPESWISTEYDFKTPSNTININLSSAQSTKLITMFYLDGKVGKTEFEDNQLSIDTWKRTEFNLNGYLV